MTFETDSDETSEEMLEQFIAWFHPEFIQWDESLSNVQVSFRFQSELSNCNDELGKCNLRIKVLDTDTNQIIFNSPQLSNYTIKHRKNRFNLWDNKKVIIFTPLYRHLGNLTFSNILLIYICQPLGWRYDSLRIICGEAKAWWLRESESGTVRDYKAELNNANHESDWHFLFMYNHRMLQKPNTIIACLHSKHSFRKSQT